MIYFVTLFQSSPESLYYVGAVVEYHPIEGLSEAAATSNVDNYIKILKKAKELNSVGFHFL